MSREELIALYGDRYMQTGSPNFLDYYYDSAAKKLRVDPKKDMPTGSAEEAEQLYILSARLNVEERAEFISIMDRRWDVFMN
ncbi:hypothetical protein [Saccharibacillus brassicae]|uniref:Uncharacterized protein n=1 Tax=Saccharibacillus brassicae TaxID=2583377 RepID=A0A4Y6UW93_SACBS|nr:hypothetical protein [Saccharibacillus brassicae]QDH21993.1 hypothetical protein FFV09_14775 [Saccharibacillus brassicae]